MLENAITFLNSSPGEVVCIIEFIFLLTFLIVSSSFFKEKGIICFIITTMVLANLQVLKVSSFTFYPEPIALGKLSICFTFLAVDLLAECYGKKSAYRGIGLGVLSTVSFTIIMIITLGYPPILKSQPNFHEHLKLIFSITPGILLAGLSSFVLSQMLEVSVFLKLRERFKGKFLGTRLFLSTCIASFVDNIIFYTLAFYVFNKIYSIDTLIYSYILGTFIFRVVFVFISSFIIHINKKIILYNDTKNDREQWVYS